MGSYDYRPYPYRRPPELEGKAMRRPVVIVGAGMAGPTLALGLALRGVPSVVLDEDDTVSLGSRSICQAKHSLEVWDRFGVAGRMIEKGIVWDQGEVFLRDKPIFGFNLQPEPHHKFPAFVNLQQYYVEEFLFERCLAEPLIEFRFRNKVVGVQPAAKGVTVEVETQDGRYTLEADWLIACDGAHSAVRRLMALPYPGEVFRDQFLITDIRFKGDLPRKRCFWFYPPFHPTNSVLLHRQADDVIRVDFQLGPDADAEEEKKPENVDRRLRQMFGPDARWEHEWTSVYTFSCRMLERFVQGRVIFAGDAAHIVSPFGARGGNGAIGDVDNLAWKLALVVGGQAPASLLDSYDHERRAAARENIRQSTRSTDFITPKFPASRAFRDATLALAHDFPFARALINSGRLSTPTSHSASSIDTEDTDNDWAGGPGPGRVMLDGPISGDGDGWLIDRLGHGFVLLSFHDHDHDHDHDRAAECAPLSLSATVAALLIAGDGSAAAPPGWKVLRDRESVLQQRYDARAGTTYLIRPDRYVAGRWRRFDAAAVDGALRRASGHA